MNQANKIIKYLAIAFGLFLVFNIISGLMFGLLSIGNIFKDESIEFKESEINQNIEILEIDVNSVNIIIKESNLFKVETNNKYIDYNQKDNKLSITEKKHNWFKKDINDLIIYIPSNTIFKNLELKNGAGKLEIETLSTENLKLKLGAGKVEIDYLEVSKSAKIDGGAGEITILDGNINDLDMDIGVGKFTLISSVTGNSKIDAGVGELNLTLNGSKDDYKIKVDKGIGSFKISGNDIVSGTTYGNGEYIIDIDGGIGSIKIDFSNKIENNVVKKYTRTYNLLHKTQEQEENSYYLTLQEFQGEVDTVLVKNIEQNLEVGKNYEFNFERIYLKNIEDNINSIFTNSKLISIIKTDKVALEQVQDSIN